MIVDVIIGGKGSFSLLPEATLIKKGIVMLTNTIDPNNESDAATPKGVYNKVQALSDQVASDFNDLYGGVPGQGKTLKKLYDLIVQLQTLVASDDLTLDTVQEIVTFIKNNKDVIDSISTNKVNISDIVDNLTSNEANKPLSANQGRVLNLAVLDRVKTVDIVDSLTSTLTDKPLSANQGKELKALIDASAGYLKLDQTTPQTILNGMPVFGDGMNIGDTKVSILPSGGPGYTEAYWKVVEDASNQARIVLKSSSEALNSTLEFTIYENGAAHRMDQNKYGVRLVNHDATHWGDDNLITKGYADAAYSGNGKKLASFYTDVQTSGTGETDLYVYLIPANTLNFNGDEIQFNCTIAPDSETFTGYVHVTLGGYSKPINLYYTQTPYIIRITFIRISSTKVRFSFNLLSSAADSYYEEPETTFDFTESIVIKIGASASSGTATAKTGTIVKL